MSKNSERVKKWRRNTKRRLVEAFGNKCACCSYDRCDEALEFHHINPSEKDFALSDARGNIVSWKRIVDEIRKCVMLCSCCHKEIHHGLREIPEDAPRFNEDYYDYRKKKEQLMEPCPGCGDDKTLLTKFCSRACATKNNRKVDWDNVDVIALYEKHQNYSKIGDMFGVTGAAIKRRMDRIQTGKY